MINELAKEIHENNKKQGFYDKETSIPEKLALVHSEVSEALECDRKGYYMYPEVIDISTTKDDYEEWREIEGYEGEYEVSNLGEVRSLDMKVWGGKTYYTKTGRVLKAGISGTGYYTVALRGKTHKVSRLVGKAFCDGYTKGLCINHINGVKTDDYSNNLEWVTYSDNNIHAIRSGLKDMTKILSKKDMCDIAAYYKYGKMSVNKIHADKYPQVSLSRIKTIAYNADKYLDVFELEMADIMIRVMDLSAYMGIDIESHIKAKVRYNTLRPKMHGNKKY